MTIHCETELLHSGLNFSHDTGDYRLLLDFFEEKGFPITGHNPISSDLSADIFKLVFDGFTVNIKLSNAGTCDVQVSTGTDEDIHPLQYYNSDLKTLVFYNQTIQEIQTLKGSPHIKRVDFLGVDDVDSATEVLGTFDNLEKLSFLDPTTPKNFQLLRLNEKHLLKELIFVRQMDYYSIAAILETPNLEVLAIETAFLEADSANALFMHPTLRVIRGIDYNNYSWVRKNKFWEELSNLGATVESSGLCYIK